MTNRILKHVRLLKLQNHNLIRNLATTKWTLIIPAQIYIIHLHDKKKYLPSHST